MKNFNLLLFVFFLKLSLLLSSVQAAEIRIGVSKSNAGPVGQSDIENILKCTTRSRKHRFSFESFPNLRGLKYIKEGKIDAYYPVHVNDKNMSFSLLPIYIDEVILISKKMINLDENIEVGLIRGEHENLIKGHPKLKPEFIVTSTDSLLKGLKSNRIGAILLYRSQLPEHFDFHNYDTHTFLFKDVGIQISESFEKKVKANRDSLQNNFIRCILNYDFRLSKIRKRAIQHSISKDIKNIASRLIMNRVEIKDIGDREKRWRADNKKLKNSILKNSLTQKLEKLAKDYPFVTEAFVFNHQGGLLSTLKMTSDFDQSDEEKFQILKEFKEFSIRNISNIYFDESSNSFEVGIYIRLHDSKGRFAGGLYIGADINKLISFYKLN